MELPYQVELILKRLEEANFEAYVVGGAVRNHILNKLIEDYDICTNASINDIKLLFKEYKIIEVGIIGGTVALIIDEMTIEVTVYRTIKKTLKDDLLNRDFTINSIAYSTKGAFISYGTSMEDLKDGIIRINGNDERIFIEDPLRILRAIRLSSKYDFKIDETTKNYMFENALLLNNVSKERIKEEFSKILNQPNPSLYLREYFDVFTVFIPELKKLQGFEQHNDYHIYDCLEHTLKVTQNTYDDLIIRLVALFHDIGKPDCFSIDENNVGHFYGHNRIGMVITKNILENLKYDNNTIRRVTHLIYFHNYPTPLNLKSAKKLLNKFGVEDLNYLYEIKKADLLGKNPKYFNELEKYELAKTLIQQVLDEDECFSLKNLSVNGTDLINIGITDGKTIGNVLNHLLDMVIDEKIDNNYESLIKEAINIKKE